MSQIELYKDYRDGVAFKAGAWLNQHGGCAVADVYGVPVADLNVLSLDFKQEPVSILYEPHVGKKRHFRRPRRRWIATIYFDDHVCVGNERALATPEQWIVELRGEDMMGVAKAMVEGVIAGIDPLNITALYVLKDARPAFQQSRHYYGY